MNNEIKNKVININKKACLIIPYFGQMPNYFQLFLNSCKYNKKYKWLIFTDDTTEYIFPENVEKVNMTFEECKKIINKKFDFEVCIPNPKKLCDYKPAYGYIFSEYLSKYDFWGYCDLDLIFGNLDLFITEEMLNKYDKLYNLGHFTLYRNTEEINTLFMKPLEEKEIYKDIFQTESMCCFDEWSVNSINNLFIQEKKKMFSRVDFADIGAYNSYFQLVYFNVDNRVWNEENIKNNIFKVEDGKLFKIYKNKDKIEKKEYMYIHLQKRNMKINVKNNITDKFYIVPNKFINYIIDNDDKLLRKYKYLTKLNYKYWNKNISNIRSNLIGKISKTVKNGNSI